MRLAVITCAKLPQGTEEDQLLFQALDQLNINYTICVWTDSVTWSDFDVCLLRSVWDYHERFDEFNTWLAQLTQFSTVINPIEMIRWNQNKHYLVDLQQFGITIAPTIWLKSNTAFDLSQFCMNNPDKHFFLKPVIGADSSGTIRFNKAKSQVALAQQHLDEWITKNDMMLQPFIPSVETFGETSIICINGDFTHAIRKIPKKGDYRVQDTFGAQDVPYHPNAAELSLSKACLQYIAQKFSVPLYARFDFLHGDDGCVFLNEAELIEPSLFFHHCPEAATQLAMAITCYFDDSDSA